MINDSGDVIDIDSLLTQKFDCSLYRNGPTISPNLSAVVNTPQFELPVIKDDIYSVSLRNQLAVQPALDEEIREEFNAYFKKYGAFISELQLEGPITNHENSDSSRKHEISSPYSSVPPEYFDKKFKLSQHRIMNQPLEKTFQEVAEYEKLQDTFDTHLTKKLNAKLPILMKAVVPVSAAIPKFTQIKAQVVALRSSLEDIKKTRFQPIFRSVVLAQRRARMQEVSTLLSDVSTVIRIFPTLRVIAPGAKKTGEKDWKILLDLFDSVKVLLAGPMQKLKLAESLVRELADLQTSISHIIENNFVSSLAERILQPIGFDGEKNASSSLLSATSLKTQINDNDTKHYDTFPELFEDSCSQSLLSPNILEELSQVKEISTAFLSPDECLSTHIQEQVIPALIRLRLLHQSLLTLQELMRTQIKKKFKDETQSLLQKLIPGGENENKQSPKLSDSLRQLLHHKVKTRISSLSPDDYFFFFKNMIFLSCLLLCRICSFHLALLRCIGTNFSDIVLKKKQLLQMQLPSLLPTSPYAFIPPLPSHLSSPSASLLSPEFTSSNPEIQQYLQKYSSTLFKGAQQIAEDSIHMTEHIANVMLHRLGAFCKIRTENAKSASPKQVALLEGLSHEGLHIISQVLRKYQQETLTDLRNVAEKSQEWGVAPNFDEFISPTSLLSFQTSLPLSTSPVTPFSPDSSTALPLEVKAPEETPAGEEKSQLEKKFLSFLPHIVPAFSAKILSNPLKGEERHSSPIRDKLKDNDEAQSWASSSGRTTHPSEPQESLEPPPSSPRLSSPFLSPPLFVTPPRFHIQLRTENLLESLSQLANAALRNTHQNKLTQITVVCEEETWEAPECPTVAQESLLFIYGDQAPSLDRVAVWSQGRKVLCFEEGIECLTPSSTLSLLQTTHEYLRMFVLLPSIGDQCLSSLASVYRSYGFSIVRSLVDGQAVRRGVLQKISARNLALSSHAVACMAAVSKQVAQVISRLLRSLIQRKKDTQAREASEEESEGQSEAGSERQSEAGSEGERGEERRREEKRREERRGEEERVGDANGNYGFASLSVARLEEIMEACENGFNETIGILEKQRQTILDRISLILVSRYIDISNDWYTTPHPNVLSNGKADEKTVFDTMDFFDIDTIASFQPSTEEYHPLELWKEVEERERAERRGKGEERERETEEQEEGREEREEERRGEERRGEERREEERGREEVEQKNERLKAISDITFHIDMPMPHPKIILLAKDIAAIHRVLSKEMSADDVRRVLWYSLSEIFTSIVCTFAFSNASEEERSFVKKSKKNSNKLNPNSKMGVTRFIEKMGNSHFAMQEWQQRAFFMGTTFASPLYQYCVDLLQVAYAIGKTKDHMVITDSFISILDTILYIAIKKGFAINFELQIRKLKSLLLTMQE